MGNGFSHFINQVPKDLLRSEAKKQAGKYTKEALDDKAPKTPIELAREFFENEWIKIHTKDFKEIFSFDEKNFNIGNIDNGVLDKTIGKAIKDARELQNEYLNKKHLPGLFKLDVVDDVNYLEKAINFARDRITENGLNGPEGHTRTPSISSDSGPRHTREGFDIAKETNASVSRDYIEKALGRDFTRDQILKGIEEGDNLNGPEGNVHDLDRSAGGAIARSTGGITQPGGYFGEFDTRDWGGGASSSNRDTGTAQSKSNSGVGSSLGYFGGNGPGDGSIAPGSGGGSSTGSTPPAPRSKPSNTSGGDLRPDFHPIQRGVRWLIFDLMRPVFAMSFSMRIRGA